MASSWQDRLRPSIVLTSPEGNRFEALFQGGEGSLQKRISRTAHPEQDGETAQDLGAGSWDYPLTFFFSGPDCDTEARRFSNAVAERGVWDVIHPVIGLLRLMPVKISLALSPTKSGNVVEISGEWFVPAEDPAPISSDETAAVKAAVSEVARKAQEDVAQITSKIAASGAALREVAGQFRKGLDAVKKTLRSANSRVTAIMGTINDLTLQPYLDIAALSGSVIQLAESPGLFVGSIANRVSMFARLGQRIITGLPAAAQFSVGQITAALTGELWLNAVSCGLGTTITQGLPETRTEVLYALKSYRDFSTRSRDALDALAKAASSNPIGAQYFPRATSMEAILNLNAVIARYLLGVVFDLKTEKIITLERPTNPMLLAIKEYKCPAAEVDYFFDLFCRSNNLHGREILLLDRGREVVVYV